MSNASHSFGAVSAGDYVRVLPTVDVYGGRIGRVSETRSLRGDRGVMLGVSLYSDPERPAVVADFSRGEVEMVAPAYDFRAVPAFLPMGARVTVGTVDQYGMTGRDPHPPATAINGAAGVVVNYAGWCDANADGANGSILLTDAAARAMHAESAPMYAAPNLIAGDEPTHFYYVAFPALGETGEGTGAALYMMAGYELTADDADPADDPYGPTVQAFVSAILTGEIGVGSDEYGAAVHAVAERFSIDRESAATAVDFSGLAKLAEPVAAPFDPYSEAVRTYIAARFAERMRGAHLVAAIRERFGADPVDADAAIVYAEARADDPEQDPREAQEWAEKVRQCGHYLTNEAGHVYRVQYNRVPDGPYGRCVTFTEATSAEDAASVPPSPTGRPLRVVSVRLAVPTDAAEMAELD